MREINGWQEEPEYDTTLVCFQSRDGLAIWRSLVWEKQKEG
jgi:hypothetical protein